MITLNTIIRRQLSKQSQVPVCYFFPSLETGARNNVSETEGIRLRDTNSASTLATCSSSCTWLHFIRHMYVADSIPLVVGL